MTIVVVGAHNTLWCILLSWKVSYKKSITIPNYADLYGRFGVSIKWLSIINQFEQRNTLNGYKKFCHVAGLIQQGLE